MKQSKTLLRTFLFFIFIFLAALAGLPTAYGYLHPADPLILLAAMLLPAPHALLATGFGSVLADVFKGFYLLAPVTLALKLAKLCGVTVEDIFRYEEEPSDETT